MILSVLLQVADMPAMPLDWAVMAPVPYAEPPVLAPTLSTFVAGEVAAGRCTVPRPSDGHYVLRVDVAALVTAEGIVRRAVPHAIDCPTVEQYAAGLVLGFARGNLAPRGAAADTWYRATITFDWRG